MNRRALLIALVVGILGVFLLLLYQRRFELEASGGEKVKLLIAVKPHRARQAHPGRRDRGPRGPDRLRRRSLDPRGRQEQGPRPATRHHGARAAAAALDRPGDRLRRSQGAQLARPPRLPRRVDPRGPRRHEHHAPAPRGLRRRHRRARRRQAARRRAPSSSSSACSSSRWAARRLRTPSTRRKRTSSRRTSSR